MQLSVEGNSLQDMQPGPYSLQCLVMKATEKQAFCQVRLVPSQSIPRSILIGKHISMLTQQLAFYV